MMWFLPGLALILSLPVLASEPCPLEQVILELDSTPHPLHPLLDGKLVHELQDDEWKNLILVPFKTHGLYAEHGAIYLGVDAQGTRVVVAKYVIDPFEALSRPSVWFQPVEIKGAAKREIAAYELSKTLGLELVPKTTLGKTKDPYYLTLQEYLDETRFRSAHDRGKDFTRQVSKEDAQNAVLFDYLIGNLDRHTQNWMIGEDGRLRLIDHGDSFHHQKKPVIDPHLIYDHLPQGSGLLEESVRMRFLRLRMDAFRSLLEKTRISTPAKNHALTRLTVLHTILRQPHPKTEEITQIARQVDVFRQKMLGLRPKKGGSFVGIFLIGGTGSVTSRWLDSSATPHPTSQSQNDPPPPLAHDP